MFRWAAIPFVRITFLLISGILIQHHTSIVISQTLFIGFIILLCLVLYFCHKYVDKYISGIILLACMVGIGFFRSQEYQDILPNPTLESSEGYLAIVDQYPTHRSTSNSYLLKIYAYIRDSSIIEANQFCQLNISRDSIEHYLSYGDRVFISAPPRRIEKNKNPGSFDYSGYMANRKVFYQHWTQPDQITYLETNQSNMVLSYVFKIRSHYEEVIKRSITMPEERGIALALLLGIKGDLDPKTKVAFSKTGAMHVLAVSGLHVGIIYFIISGFIKRLNIGIVRSWITPILSITIIWLYALITGFSPSILRASLMFSLIIVSKAFRTKTNGLNTVAVSAFILLLFNPNFIFDVGFQLSYAAIIGIISLYNPIYDLWKPKNWMTDQLWSLFCISIVAQVSTAPIGIYYFHQFPLLFLFSNLIVFLLIYPIMITGILLLLTNSLYISQWVAQLLEALINLLNMGISTLNNIEWNSLQWLYLSTFQLFLVYAVIICIMLTFWRKQIQWVWISVVLAGLISIESIITIFEQNKNQKLIFYSDYRIKSFDQINGLHNQLLSYGPTPTDQFIDSYVDPYHLKNGLNPTKKETCLLSPEYKLTNNLYGYVLDSTRYLFVTKNHLEPTQAPIKTDYLIISNNSVRTFDQLEKLFDFKTLIIDASNWKEQADHLITNAHLNGYEAFDLRDQALTINF